MTVKPPYIAIRFVNKQLGSFVNKEKLLNGDQRNSVETYQNVTVAGIQLHTILVLYRPSFAASVLNVPWFLRLVPSSDVILYC